MGHPWYAETQKRDRDNNGRAAWPRPDRRRTNSRLFNDLRFR